MYEPWPERKYPPAWRVTLAFLITPGAAALLMAAAMAVLTDLPSVWGMALVLGVYGAYPSAILFGVPAYFMLRPQIAARPFACALVGFVVAVLPWTLLVLAGSGASEALENAKFLASVGLFGAVGGLVFWAIAALGNERSHGTPAAQQKES